MEEKLGAISPTLQGKLGQGHVLFPFIGSRSPWDPIYKLFPRKIKFWFCLTKTANWGTLIPQKYFWSKWKCFVCSFWTFDRIVFLWGVLWKINSSAWKNNLLWGFSHKLWQFPGLISPKWEVLESYSSCSLYPEEYGRTRQIFWWNLKNVNFYHIIYESQIPKYNMLWRRLNELFILFFQWILSFFLFLRQDGVRWEKVSPKLQQNLGAVSWATAIQASKRDPSQKPTKMSKIKKWYLQCVSDSISRTENAKGVSRISEQCPVKKFWIRCKICLFVENSKEQRVKNWQCISQW